ncbi:MAG TPA: oligosaccharide flippase family protein [Patescibacteria group bacterium]|nr:oligosaccharide flippase family protein [Patescibacteria group bacterium]
MEKIKEIFLTATFRQSSLTTFGTIANGFLGAIFYILVARMLGPAQFGLFSIATLVLNMVADIGDLGTNTGLVRFVGGNRVNNPEKANRFLKLGLEVKILASIVIGVVGVLASSWIAVFLFKKPELTNLLQFAFIGVSGSLLFSFILTTLQAYERFWSWSLIQVISNSGRVILIIFFYNFLTVSPITSMGIYIVIPLLSFIAGLFVTSTRFFKVRGETSEIKEFFHYNKWVALFTLIAAFSARLDSFLTARYLTFFEIGIYAAATRVTQIVPQIVGAISTVVAPKMAGIGTKSEFIEYMKKTQLFVFSIALLGILSIPVISYLIPIIFGSAYSASIPIFIVLLFAMLFLLISIPVHTAVFYYFSYPKLFVWISTAHLIIVALSGYFFIPTYGVMAIAYSVLFAGIVDFVVPGIWVLNKLRKA